MPKFAYYDHTQPDPSRVMGWFDTDALDYPTLPDAEDLLEMADEQWDARLNGYWAVDDGALVPYTPPVPPPTADEVYQSKISDGIGIISSSNPALNGVYPLTSQSLALVGAIARDAASGLGLPNDAPTVSISELSGVSHDFDETEVITLYKATRDLTSAMLAQRDIMASGGAPQWPAQIITIA